MYFLISSALFFPRERLYSSVPRMSQKPKTRINLILSLFFSKTATLPSIISIVSCDISELSNSKKTSEVGRLMRFSLEKESRSRDFRISWAASSKPSINVPSLAAPTAWVALSSAWERTFSASSSSPSLIRFFASSKSFSASSYSQVSSAPSARASSSFSETARTLYSTSAEGSSGGGGGVFFEHPEMCKTPTIKKRKATAGTIFFMYRISVCFKRRHRVVAGKLKDGITLAHGGSFFNSPEAFFSLRVKKESFSERSTFGFRDFLA